MKKSIGAKTQLFPTPVLMVGTYDQAGKPNLMIAAWGGICCSQPPCIAVSLRKATYSSRRQNPTMECGDTAPLSSFIEQWFVL